MNEERTITITIEEYADLIACRTRMKVLIDWAAADEYMGRTEMRRILGLFAKGGSDD